MNRLRKIARGLSVKSGLGAYDRILMDRLQGVGASSGDFLLEEAYEKIDLVYSCISYTAKAIAQIPLQVVQFSNKSNKFEPVGDGNPWQRVIDQPNYMTSKIQFVTGLISFLLLDGCVAVIPFPPSPVTNPDALWTIRWEHIKYELDKNNHLVKWVYKPQGDQGVKYEFKPWEIFQIKFWNPDHPIEGWAPIKAGRLPVQELYKSSQYNQRFFDKGAIPGGVLSTSQTLKKEDVALIKGQWGEQHQSWMKSWEPAVLHRDLKWEPTGISQKDMDFINMRDKSNESIMQIFGMKKVILGKTDSLNYCIPASEKVYTCDRGPVSIKDIVKDELVWSFSEDGPVKRKVLNSWCQGEKNVFKLKTLHRSLRASHDHPVLVLEKEVIEVVGVPHRKNKGTLVWKKMEDLKIGDLLVITKGLPLQNEVPYSYDFIKFAGAVLGDGYIPKNFVQLAIPEYQQELREEYIRIAKSEFSYKKKCFLDKELVPFIGKTAISFHGNARDKLVAAGINGTCKEKRVPDWVFKLDRKGILSFLRGLFDTDGSVGKRDGVLYFASANKILIYQAAMLLDILGISRTIVKYEKKVTNFTDEKGKDIYTFTVSDVSEIGSDLSVRQERIDRNNYKKEFIASEDRLSRTKQYTPIGVGGAFEVIPDMFTVEKVRSLACEGEEEVYDLEVEDRHNFICEGVVVHNSVAREQRKEWWAGTCLPLMRLTSDALTFGLFRSPQNYERFKSFRVQFDISAIEALHEDYSAKVKTGEGLFRMGVPFEEINEMLELGFENKPWYTLAFVPVNMMCVNYEDVGRENPMPPGQDVNNPTPDQETTPPKPEEDEPENASSEAAQTLLNYMKETKDMQINRIADIGYPSSKSVHNKIRRNLFDMRAKCLQILMDNKEKPLEAIKGMITDYDFYSEINKSKEGIIIPWNETLEQIESTINGNGAKIRVDNSDSCAIRQTWVTSFLDELVKLIEVKKKEVLEILTKEDSVDKVASSIRKLFNLSLNEVWPLVKAEVRRQVVLVLGAV